MKVNEVEVRVPSPGGDIRATVIRPVGDATWPGLLLYTDIFQRTESTLRTAAAAKPEHLPGNKALSLSYQSRPISDDTTVHKPSPHPSTFYRNSDPTPLQSP